MAVLSAFRFCAEITNKNDLIVIAKAIFFYYTTFLNPSFLFVLKKNFFL